MTVIDQSQATIVSKDIINKYIMLHVNMLLNKLCLCLCFYGAIRQTNMATDSFNIYLSPVGVKSLNRFVINWQAGAKLIRHVRQYNGFVTLA